jgi:hypothetical protein
MCRNHGARMLATAATIAALAAPAAHAKPIGAGEPFTAVPIAEHHTIQGSHPSSSPDWELIVIAGGAVILTGVGLGGSRRLARQRTPAA